MKQNENDFSGFRYAGLDKCEVNNGNGVGATLFVQGCSHHCKECQNPSTWDKNGGMQFTQKVYDELFSALSDDYIKRLTLSGGDPFDTIDFSYFIAKEFKEKHPDKKLWIYTGYSFENLCSEKNKKLLNLADVLVDGEFKIEQKNLRLLFRGSENQRIIDVPKTLAKNKIVLWHNKECDI